MIFMVITLNCKKGIIMTIERFYFETDEDYATRCACIQKAQQELKEYQKSLAQLSNTELCAELKTLGHECGVLGLYEYVLEEAIKRLSYMQ